MFYARRKYHICFRWKHSLARPTYTAAASADAVLSVEKNTKRMAIANGTCVSFCTFWPPLGYAPVTIAVNVTWVERGFNAGQMHSSIIYPSIFNRLRAIARCWSEIATFSYLPLHLTPPLGCSHWNSGEKFGPQKTRIMGLPRSEDSLTIGWAVSTQYQLVMDRQTDRRQTDGRTAYSYNVRNMTTHVKNSLPPDPSDCPTDSATVFFRFFRHPF